MQESKPANGETPSLFKENYPPPRTYYSLIGCSPSAELTSRGRQSTSSHKIPLAHAQIICLPLRTQLSAPSCNGECGRGSQQTWKTVKARNPLSQNLKFFFHSINPKMKSKAHTEPSTVSTPGKVAKTSKENVDRGLPHAKSPTKKTKPEDSRGPKAQFSSSEKSVMASLLTAPHIVDSKLRPRSRQLGSVSILGNSRHCPRHCPRLAYATHHRNLP